MALSTKQIIMLNKWYSDNRDLVKWSTLLLIAKEHHSERIFQIAYYRESHYGKLEIDGKEYAIPSEVLAHFRDINKITKLTPYPEIIVFDSEFSERGHYLEAIKKIINKYVKQRCIIFLDPDTGLEPYGKPNHNHVLENELKEIWGELPSNWLLVFYQHKTTKSSKEWIEPKRRQFCEAINIPLIDVKIASGFDIANDVVFFFAIKK